MLGVFFDLETSDTSTLGQILNYSFIAVDRDFAPIDELSGEIAISRLQLPRAGAILANRIDVREHQARATDSEARAMARIASFLQSLCARSKVCLIGYNSNRFDLPYLRTSLISQGINPYFAGQLIYRDMLHLVKSLACRDSSFPLPAKDGRLSLSLESTAQSLGLLAGAQTHNSRDDVLLTIELAKACKERFQSDIFGFEAYEAVQFHGVDRGVVVNAIYPNYDTGHPGRAREVPMTLLDFNHRYSLWIDLQRYQEGQGRECISWYNPAVHHFFCGESPALEGIGGIAKRALDEFASIKLSNFFAPSECDIQADIYRLDFDGIASLGKAIWERDVESLKNSPNRDLKVLFLRHQISSHAWGAAGDGRIAEMLKKYALYRYGGQANVSKIPGAPVFHPSFRQMMAELEEAMQAGSPSDKALLAALKEFYLASDIYRLAGAELEALTDPICPDLAAQTGKGNQGSRQG